MSLFEPVFGLIFFPLGGLFQAVVGLLWPAENPAIRRLQRITLLFVLVGLGFCGAGAALLFVGGMASHGFFCLIVGLICFAVGGYFGGEIERRTGGNVNELPRVAGCLPRGEFFSMMES
jgi:hypothetical protein